MPDLLTGRLAKKCYSETERLTLKAGQRWEAEFCNVVRAAHIAGNADIVELNLNTDNLHVLTEGVHCKRAVRPRQELELVHLKIAPLTLFQKPNGLRFFSNSTIS